MKVADREQALILTASLNFSFIVQVSMVQTQILVLMYRKQALDSNMTSTCSKKTSKRLASD